MKRLLKILRDRRRKRRADVLYLCDKKACSQCRPDCLHTTDPNHAVNFSFAYDRCWVEQERCQTLTPEKE